MIRGIIYIIVICIQFRIRTDSKIMKHKFLQLDQESKFLNMSKGSREKDIENLFPIVTKSSIFFFFLLDRRD
jgi:lipid A disaccharide synthetase